MYPYLRQIVFDLALSLTYDAQSKGVNSKFTDGLIESINQISYFHASTLRLRLCPDFTISHPRFRKRKSHRSTEKRRQKYLDVVYAALQERIAAGEKIDCTVNGLVKDNSSEAGINGTCKPLL
jgi:phenylacetate 2-hydroxylase